MIYLDHGASTPLDPSVLEAMLPYWTADYGNPSSHHAFGRQASAGLDKARNEIALLLNARPDEIVFTGCGSESDNMALRGVMWAARRTNNGNHLIISAIEHSAIKKTAEQLVELFDFELTILPVDGDGRINLGELAAAMRPDTALVSIMAANNEIGTLQPVFEIGELLRGTGVLFHTDAIQAAAIQKWDMHTMPVDLLSIAPHKFYGPKGIGILYVRQGVALEPTLTGGGQENGRRSGTVNVPFAVGAAKAMQLAMHELSHNVEHYTQLRDVIIRGILDGLNGEVCLTGHPTERLPHNASFAFRGISGNDLLMHLDMKGIAASSGSACKTGDPKPSAILEAIGLGPEWTTGGLRLTVGRQNTLEEIEKVVDTVLQVTRKLRSLSASLA